VWGLKAYHLTATNASEPGMHSLGRVGSRTRGPIFQRGYMVVPKAKGG